MAVAEPAALFSSSGKNVGGCRRHDGTGSLHGKYQDVIPFEGRGLPRGLPMSSK